MAETAPSSLHQLPASVDVIAMVVSALFGAHGARHRSVPLFGVLLAGVIAGLGGGMVRDVLLGLEPAAITDWYYIPAVLVAAIVGGSIAYQVSLDPLPFVGAQAVAIGLLIGIGVQKAVAYGAPPPSAILLGVITATFGGALDDVLTGRRATIMREGPWLLSVIVAGSLTFWLLTSFVGFYPAVLVTVTVVASLRLLSVSRGWSSPVFPGDDLQSSEEGGAPSDTAAVSSSSQSGTFAPRARSGKK
jgi:uncharacterized membrane protein YeiH